MKKVKVNKAPGLTLNELEDVICEPSEYSSQMKENAILRLWCSHGFIEYPRKRLKKLFKELKIRVNTIACGLDEPTELDRFLLIVLKSMGGDLD